MLTYVEYQAIKLHSTHIHPDYLVLGATGKLLFNFRNPNCLDIPSTGIFQIMNMLGGC